MNTVTMNTIEAKAKTLAGARDELAERVAALEEELNAARRRRLQGIKNSAERMQTALADLRADVESAPELFDKPKTRVLHGFRVGWMKQRGKLEFDDAEALVAAIRKQLPDQADGLIKTTEAPVRNALSNLSARDLKRLGVSVTDDTDVVVIKPANSDLEKLLAALFNDTELEDLT